MIDGKRIVAFIPVRGGSKSIPNKNLAMLGDKPLLAWPIELAAKVPEIDEIIVSTDSEVLAREAELRGARVQFRPDNLATDTAVVADVIRYCREQMFETASMADYMVLLEATSPFRSVALVQSCLHRLHFENLDSIASFSEAEINPHRTWAIQEGEPTPFIPGAIPWQSRQLLPKAFQLNGAVYAFNLHSFPETGPAVLFGKMGAEILDREAVIDIDTQKDLVIANVLLRTQLHTEIN